MTYILNILHICQLYLNKAGKAHINRRFWGKAGVEARVGVGGDPDLGRQGLGRVNPPVLAQNPPPPCLDALGFSAKAACLDAEGAGGPGDQALIDGLWEMGYSPSEWARGLI